MKNLFKNIFMLMAVLMATGCSTADRAVQTKEDSNMLAQQNIYNEFKDAPQWVLSPVSNGDICAVGSAMKNSVGDFSFQRNEALADARNNMAQQIEVAVGSMLKSYKSQTGHGTNETMDRVSESVSKQVASQTLAGTVQKSAWISRSGTMYVFIAVDPKIVVKAAREIARSSYDNDQALHQKLAADSAQKDLVIEIEKKNKEAKK